MDLVRREIVVADGTTISYACQDGAGPPVVILHGLAGSGREFEATARALTGRRVVLIDQRNHGHSTRHPLDTSRATFVSDAASVIAAESAVPVDLVGQSLGAHTAMLLAASNPLLVRRLVLLECDAGGTRPEEADALGEYFGSWPIPFADRSAAVAALGEGPLATAWIADLEERPEGLSPRFEPAVMVDALRANATPRWPEWERVTAPTLVAYGEDGMFSEDQKAEFVRRGVHVQRVDLAHALHDAHLDAFDQWIGALRGFLGVR
ncbi:alpha/beta hydrolase [Microbacterium sp. NPDC086615]|jgi:pimeloyl-ACP methyl ester carboxylesterase|uniref:alpha/beta fold hydrolase n=1 Tax=Microbacterium sp. NPDC086615 TaxID=3154865 RepID=UPI003419C776|nr:alpha/beta hydrolase [Microbacterium sp.]